MKRGANYLTDDILRKEIVLQLGQITKQPTAEAVFDERVGPVMAIVLQSIRPPDRKLPLGQFSAEIIVPSIRLVLGRSAQ